MGGSGLHETLSVRRSQSFATARVIESREMLTRFGMSYDVKYVFSPAEGESEIGRGDFTGRSALWSSLPQDRWMVAVATGQIRVRYDPRSPINNAPEDNLPSIWDQIAPLVLGAFLLTCVVVVERMRLKQIAR